MGRRFTAEDRQNIRQNIVEHARRKFTKEGFQKTSIGGITEAVGIAQGSFYNFFASKEALYFHILAEEEQLFQNKLLNYTFAEKGTPEQALTQLLQHMLYEVQKHPLFQQLFS